MFSFVARGLAGLRCSGWCGAELGFWGDRQGEVWERGAPSGARERTREKGGVKGSAGGRRTSDAGRVHNGASRALVITGRRCCWRELRPDWSAAAAAAGPAEGLAGRAKGDGSQGSGAFGSSHLGARSHGAGSAVRSDRAPLTLATLAAAAAAAARTNDLE